MNGLVPLIPLSQIFVSLTQPLFHELSRSWAFILVLCLLREQANNAVVTVSKKIYSISFCLNDTLDDASAYLSETNSDISFAPNVTPGTFNAPTPHHSGSDALSPVLEGSTGARRSGHSRKKSTNHIPRPPNAFILFRSSFIKSQHVSSEVETNHSTLSKIIGLTWKNLPNEERQIWHARAKVAFEEHKRKFPSYAFKPVHNKPRGVPAEKRKVREVGLKDHTRCAKIAELLVRGKKGLELEVAIQEFDKNHVPEIVTRFEAPITANNYALSSMNNTDERRLSHSSRRSQAPLSPPSIIDPAPEVEPEPCGEGSYDTPSFNQHSLASPASSPSFVSLFHLQEVLTNFEIQDFNTFSLSYNNPSSSFDTLALAASPLPFAYNQHDLVHPRPSISIPNNFRLTDNWAQSGSSESPVSNSTGSLPTTPCQLNAPFSEPYTPIDDRSSDYTPDDPYANHSLYPTYPSVQSFSGEEYGDVQPGFIPCQLDHNLKAPVTQEDMDFLWHLYPPHTCFESRWVKFKFIIPFVLTDYCHAHWIIACNFS